MPSHPPMVVACPECGQDKWRYLGGDLAAEPPCMACQRAALPPVAPQPEDR